MAATKRTQEITAVGRLVLCKAFLAIAAVCLDSAARRCGLLLRFCIHKTCPGWARNQQESPVNKNYEKALACTENILTPRRRRELLPLGFHRGNLSLFPTNRIHLGLQRDESAIILLKTLVYASQRLFNDIQGRTVGMSVSCKQTSGERRLSNDTFIEPG